MWPFVSGLLSFSMFLKIIPIVAPISFTTFYKGEFTMIFHSMNIPHDVHSSVDGHLSCFHFFTSLNNAVMNICIQIFMLLYVSCLLGIYLAAELLNNM